VEEIQDVRNWLFFYLSENDSCHVSKSQNICRNNVVRI